MFNFASGWTERNDNFYFLFIFILFQPILAWNEAIMIFFCFLNFFTIFLEFFITRRVGKERTDNFYFFFLGFSQPILAWNETIMVYFNFFNFMAIFLECSISRRVERNGMIIFIFSFFHSFPTYFGLKWSYNDIF